VAIQGTTIGTDSLETNAVTNPKVADDAIAIAELSATGTPSSSTFLRGDNAWAAAGGGSLEFLVENSVAGGVHLSTAFSSTYLTSTYERYLITFQDLLFSADNITFASQISTDNGANYQTTSYRTAGFATEYNGSAANTTTLSTATYFMWAVKVANNSTHSLNGHIFLINPANGNCHPQAYSEIGHFAADDYSRRIIEHSVWAGGGGFNNIKFFPSSGVFQSGKFVLYGVKNS